MLTTNQKGTTAELGVALAATELGVAVYQPFGDQRCDLIFDAGGRLLRIQCKWASREGHVLVIRHRSCRRGPNGYIRRDYSAEEIDLLAAYWAEERQVYLLPPELSVGRAAIQLRLAPTRNNQAKGIHWASDFEIGATLERLLGP